MIRSTRWLRTSLLTVLLFPSTNYLVTLRLDYQEVLLRENDDGDVLLSVIEEEGVKEAVLSVYASGDSLELLHNHRVEFIVDLDLLVQAIERPEMPDLGHIALPAAH